jgi:hypothetical protein
MLFPPTAATGERLAVNLYDEVIAEFPGEERAMEWMRGEEGEWGVRNFGGRALQTGA